MIHRYSSRRGPLKGFGTWVCLLSVIHKTSTSLKMHDFNR